MALKVLLQISSKGLTENEEKKCRIGKCRKKNRKISKAVFDKLKTQKGKCRKENIEEKI